MVTFCVSKFGIFTVILSYLCKWYFLYHLVAFPSIYQIAMDVPLRNFVEPGDPVARSLKSQILP